MTNHRTTSSPLLQPSSASESFRVSRFAGEAFRVSYPAFTLLELLAVLFIIALLAAITLPSVRGFSQSNSHAQAANLARSMVTNARAIALSQHRQAGVVFFEETPKYASAANAGQTAMQLFIEDYNQAQYNPDPGNTVFIAYAAQRQYLPAGIKVVVFNDQPGRTVMTGDDKTSTPANPDGTRGVTRTILFDSTGQMITRHGIARPDVGSGNPGTFPRVTGDWNFTTKRGKANMGVSSPGLLLVDMSDYRAENFPADPSADAQRDAWIKDHSDVLLINTYTGNSIR